MFKIVTKNIADSKYERGTDYRLEYRLEVLINNLKALNADIICLQEVKTQELLDVLKQTLEMEYVYANELAVFYNTKFSMIANFGIMDSMLSVTFDRFNVLNCHFSVKANQRMEAAKEASVWMQQYEKCIVIGDLNTFFDLDGDEVMRELTNGSIDVINGPTFKSFPIEPIQRVSRLDHIIIKGMHSHDSKIIDNSLEHIRDSDHFICLAVINV